MSFYGLLWSSSMFVEDRGIKQYHTLAQIQGLRFGETMARVGILHLSLAPFSSDIHWWMSVNTFQCFKYFPRCKAGCLVIFHNTLLMISNTFQYALLPGSLAICTPSSALQWISNKNCSQGPHQTFTQWRNSDRVPVTNVENFGFSPSFTLCWMFCFWISSENRLILINIIS